MSNIKPANHLPNLLSAGAALLAAFGLVACLGGGGSSGPEQAVVTEEADPTTLTAATTPVAPGYPPPAAIPAAPLPANINAIPGVPGSVRVTTDTTGMSNGDAVQITLTAGPYDGVTAGAYDGIFIVSNVTPPGGGPGGTFDVALTFTAPSGGATTQIIAAGTPPACATTGDTLDINPVAISASRYVGVAPLAVFFDSAGTAGNATTRPFHELDYQWDFDDLNYDPGIGNWGDKGSTNGSSGSGANTSRKTDSGPVAAHVYEQPGTYRVRLTIKDVNGKSVSNNCVQIAVQDPEVIFAGKTACFSTTTDFTGCPASVPPAARIQTADFVAAMSRMSSPTSYRRLLFHRGQEFGAASFTLMNLAGPGMVGAFGAGAAPKIRSTYTKEVFRVGGPVFSDWRIVDLDIDLNTPAPVSSTFFARAVEGLGNVSDLLLQRLWIHDGYQGYVFSNNDPDAGWDKMFFVDTTFQNLTANTTNGQAVYASGHRIAYMGNRVDVTRSHNTRFPHLHGAVISHNHHNNPGSGQSNIKIPGVKATTYPGRYSERVVVSSNKFQSNSGDWMMEIQPQTRFELELLRDMIVERNLFQSVAPSFGPDAVSISGKDMTFRNNIVDLSFGTGSTGAFTVGQFGVEPPPQNVDIFHNTIYTSGGVLSGANWPPITVRNSPGMTGVRVKNNLGYGPNKVAAIPHMIEDLATGTDKSNNSSDAEVRGTAPAWVSLTPSVPADYVLTAPSYIAGDGTVPVMSDFFGNARPKPAPPSVNDIGASEFP